jgi:transposase
VPFLPSTKLLSTSERQCSGLTAVYHKGVYKTSTNQPASSPFTRRRTSPSSQGWPVDAVRVQMHCLVQQIDLLPEQVAQLDDALAELMDQIPQHITSIPGIGLASGVAILGEIGDVHLFESVDKLVAYAGIDPAVSQTGQFKASEAHMSKRGSPYLRHALWLAATVAVRYDPDLQAFYGAKRKEGKHHGTVIGAVCRKLLARIYIILKDQRPYVIR